jgi:hypothetical protein
MNTMKSEKWTVGSTHTEILFGQTFCETDIIKNEVVVAKACGTNAQESISVAKSIIRDHEAGQWLPIETAPKDWTNIIAGHNRIPPHVEQVWWDKNFNDWKNEGGVFSSDFFTHWLPLPNPPTPQTNKIK